MMEQEVHSIVKTEKIFCRAHEASREAQQKLPNYSLPSTFLCSISFVFRIGMCLSRVGNVYLCPSRLPSQLSSLFLQCCCLRLFYLLRRLVCTNQKCVIAPRDLINKPSSFI